MDRSERCRRREKYLREHNAENGEEIQRVLEGARCLIAERGLMVRYEGTDTDHVRLQFQ